MSRRPMLIETAKTVDGGAPLGVGLPEGPGFYILRRFSQVHTAGANDATHSPAVLEENANSPHVVVYAAPAPVAVATAVRWPEDNASPAEPGRHFYSGDGKLWWFPGGNVGGDEYQARFVVERVR